jgi:hypothetical protein
MKSRQDDLTGNLQQRMWQLQSYEDVQRLFRSCPSDPIFVDKLIAEWCFGHSMKEEAAAHCIKPVIHGLKYPNPFYEDVLDANAIGQCIYFLFQTCYADQRFHVLFPPDRGLSVWGKLFCLGYCYLSKSIDLLETDPTRVCFEPYEARAFFTMSLLSSRFDPFLPYMVLTEMTAFDCLRTGATYRRLGYAEDYDTWRAKAEDFVNENEPGRLDCDSLDTLARKGQDTMRSFWREREANFKKGMYACTAAEVEALAKEM